MKKLILVLILSGCAVGPNPELIKVVNNQGEAIKLHTQILTAMSAYINDLQEKRILPKPEVKKEK